MEDLSEQQSVVSENSLLAPSQLRVAVETRVEQAKEESKSEVYVRKRSQASSNGSINSSTASIAIKSTPAIALTTEQNAHVPTEPATPNDSGAGFLDGVLSTLSMKKDEDMDSITTSPTMMSYRKSTRNKRRGTSTSSIDTSILASPLSEVPKPYASTIATPDYDTNLYVEEKLKGTDYHYATIPRNEEFHKLFKSVSVEDRLLDDFSCALSRDILLQGRIYVSQNNICFNSNLLGWITNLVIPLTDIEGFEKTTTVGLFPNGIAITSKDGRNSFVSFISRDIVFAFLEQVWKCSGGEESESTHHENSSMMTMNGIPTLSKGMNLDNDALYSAYGGALMSLDDDSPRKQLQSTDESDEDEDEDESDVIEVKVAELTNQTVHRLKRNSKYKYSGIHAHHVTHCAYSPELKKETILGKVNLQCPPGLLYEFLFGEETEMVVDFLKSQDSRDFSDISSYELNSDKKKERHYEYIKGLNYSVGPRQTKCVVKETVEHYDEESYINIVNTTQTPDVPSGSAFCVKTRYIMTWGKDNTTDLTVSFWIHWIGSSWMKSIIEKSTKSGQEGATRELLSMINKVINENVEPVTEEVAIDEDATAIEESLELEAEEKPQPVTTASVKSSTDWVSIISGASPLNISVLTLLSIIIFLQLRILNTLHYVPERKIALEMMNSLDKSTEELLFKGQETLIWNWLDERTGTLNTSRRGELSVLQHEIDSVISKWASGELGAQDGQDLLKDFELRLSNYAGKMSADDEKREKIQALKDAFGALL